MQDTPALATAIRKRLAMINDTVTSYRLESGLVYRSDKLVSGGTHESIVAIIPRDTFQLVNQNARQEFMSLMVAGSDVRPGRSKERLITASNETLILTSGSGSITDRESLHAALEQALLITQVYLDAKASLQERGSAFYDSLVIKPRPQEDFDRRRSERNSFTFFSDMFEDLADNQLLRAIEAQEYPSTSFEEIKAQDALIESLQLFVSQLRDQKHFAQFGAQPPDGVLLSGPTGNGKARQLLRSQVRSRQALSTSRSRSY